MHTEIIDQFTNNIKLIYDTLESMHANEIARVKYKTDRCFFFFFFFFFWGTLFLRKHMMLIDFRGIL